MQEPEDPVPVVMHLRVWKNPLIKPGDVTEPKETKKIIMQEEQESNMVLAKKTYGQGTGKGVKKAAERVVKERRKRLLGSAGSGITQGAVFGSLLSLAVFKKNPELLKEIGFLIGIVSSVGVGWAGFTSKRNERVRKATLNVGKALSKEARKNRALREFLEKHRFVIIGAGGRLIGTESAGEKLPFVRMRLESKKILSGEYSKKQAPGKQGEEDDYFFDDFKG